MTHSGGKQHAVGYKGQVYVITVMDADKGHRINLGWSNSAVPENQLRALETKPSWTDAKIEHVRNKKTGDPF